MAGLRDILPLIPGIIPFALVSALAAREAGLDIAQAMGLSTIVFAGAAQMAFASLVGSAAVAPVIVATVLVINLRFLMYSASLAPHLRREAGWRRALMAYMLTDQAYAVSIRRYTDTPAMARKGWLYLGAALPMWLVWQVFTLGGLLLGARVPPEWGLEFTVPLVFLVLLVPAVRDRPGLEAAVVSAVVAVLLAGLPWNLGLMLGALSGVTWGVLAEARRARAGAERHCDGAAAPERDTGPNTGGQSAADQSAADTDGEPWSEGR